MQQLHRIFIIATIAALAAGIATADVTAGKLALRGERRAWFWSAHDGDTITCQFNTTTIKVRIWGIDAPELRQPGGVEAAYYLRAFLAGHTVTLNVRSVDRYGRAIATVTRDDGYDVGAAMLESGNAWWYAQYARAALNYRAHEAHARARSIGLWRTPAPEPPWYWRARHRH